jgi:HK97 family phage major capsid protein
MSLKTLLKKRAGVKAETKTILSTIQAEDREITAEEQADITAKMAEVERLNSQIDLAEKAEKMTEGESADREAGNATTTRTAAASAASNSAPALSGKKQFDSLEEFLSACISNQNDPRLEYQEYRSDQTMGSGTGGGFAVPTEFRPILFNLNRSEAIVRPRASIIPAGSSPDAEVVIPSIDDQPEDEANKVFGGVVISKVSEGGTKPTTGFELRGRSLKPYEMAARIPFTDKLLRNWTAASSWATNLLRNAMTAFEDYQFLLGNGLGGPAGIIDSLATIAIPRTTSNEVVLADLKNMFVRFAGDPSKALWVVSYSAFREFLDMTGDGGGATNIIQVDRATGSIFIYGIPVVRHDRVRALGSKGDVGLYDFSEYLIKDGSGPIVEVGYATGQWEQNRQSIKITFNVDGKTWRTKPFMNEEDFEVSRSVVLDVPSGS